MAGFFVAKVEGSNYAISPRLVALIDLCIYVIIKARSRREPARKLSWEFSVPWIIQGTFCVLAYNKKTTWKVEE